MTYYLFSMIRVFETNDVTASSCDSIGKSEYTFLLVYSNSLRPNCHRIGNSDAV